MPAHLLRRLIARGRAVAHRLRHQLMATTRPAAVPVVTGALADLARSKPALMAENAFLRHQLTILHRSVTRPRCCAGLLLYPT